MPMGYTCHKEGSLADAVATKYKREQAILDAERLERAAAGRATIHHNDQHQRINIVTQLSQICGASSQLLLLPARPPISSPMEMT